VRVKAVLQLYLKDRPKDRLGVTGETWVLGNNKELPLDAYLVGCFERAAPFFCECYTAEELNAQKDNFIDWLKEMRFEEVNDES